MIRLILTLIFLVFTSNSFATQNIFGSTKKKAKEDYAHSKCIETPTKYREKLAYGEVCKYGLSCPKQKVDKKYVMYCTKLNISECFEAKSWRTANQLLSISEEIKVGLITQGLSYKKGVGTGNTCAYYD